jgi:hypothetical protein
LYAGLFFALVLTESPWAWFFFTAFNAWEFYGYKGGPILGDMQTAVGSALIGLVVFADTFLVVFLISLILRGIPRLFQRVRVNE